MSGKKIYKGEKYAFSRNKDKIGNGGNGAVYDINLYNTEEKMIPLVAKFFEYEGRHKEKRYKRFKNEVRTLEKLNDVEGIMHIIDKRCPENTPRFIDEAWYLMPKAKPYRLDRRKGLYEKLLDMLELAKIIQSIHITKGAHRDIKPENILILNDKIVLSDFGLYWGMEENRLTELNERIGPYKIMPPEFESVKIDLDMDFRPSDVYLFAKVIWMTIKEDNIGFRGQYNRGDVQIYLDKEKYEGVETLEPLHKLIEEATDKDMTQRITIDECIEYLELQCKVLKYQDDNLLLSAIINQLIYDENRKKIMSSNEADGRVYRNKKIILKMLKDIVSISNICIKSLDRQSKEKNIIVTNIKMIKEEMFKMSLFNQQGKRIKEYILNIEKITCSYNDDEIVLELEDVDNSIIEDEEYIQYSKIGNGFIDSYNKIVFSSEQELIIKKV